MRKRIICSRITWALASAIILSGCICRFYTYDVDAEAKKNGVEDYLVVDSLEMDEYPQSLPITVTTTESTTKGDCGIGYLLGLCTLGVFPVWEYTTTTYNTTVSSPVGIRSGSCSVTGTEMIGWIPLFLPLSCEGGDKARLAKDTLKKNLVSQFPKAEYSAFVAKNNTPELKAKRVKEAAERAEAERVRLEQEAKAAAEKRRLDEIEQARSKRAEIIDTIVKNDLKSIRDAYARQKPYQCVYPRSDRKKNPRLYMNADADWLATWTGPRLEMTEEDKLAGEALLSEFGTKYLPNAYANYEKVKERALELQQVFNEEFPQPWKIDNANSKWSAFNKVLEKLAKVRAEYFLCHDELCHYWMKQKFGVLTAADYAKIDSQGLSVCLLPEDICRVGYTRMEARPLEETPLMPGSVVGYTRMEARPLEGEISDFAAKYAPESFAIYKKLEQEDKEWGLLLNEVSKQYMQIDAVRIDRTHANAISKKNDIVREMSVLSVLFKAWRMDHRTTEKTSEDIAKLDHEQALSMNCFVDSLPTYVKDRTLGPVIPSSDMLPVPGCACRMQRTEVTQLQWMIVMGDNPSRYFGADRPVEHVSFDDLMIFIKKASEMDGVQYRLPDESEWMTACLAGSKTECGKRKNGVEGPFEVMGSDYINSVALKEPNAWGFYDMHGNVFEWCKITYPDTRSWYGAKARFIGLNLGKRGRTVGDVVYDDEKICSCGFRLAE